jgi:hypothetical protein
MWIRILMKKYHKNGCAVYKAVSRRLPTTATRVRSYVMSYGIYDGQSGGCFPSYLISPALSHSTNFSTHILIILSSTRFSLDTENVAK